METRPLELRLAAGRLILASEAVQGIYHVQDPVTRQFMPLVAPPRPARISPARQWAFTPLSGPLLGAAVGAALIGLLGLAHHWWAAKPAAAKERSVAGLPLASPTTKGPVADGITVVDAAWQQPVAPVVASSAPSVAHTAPPTVAESQPRTATLATASLTTPTAAKPLASPAAPGRPHIEPKPAAPQERRPPTGTGDKAREESPVVFNEPAPVRPINGDGLGRAAGSSVVPTTKVGGPIASGSGSGGVRLVAVKDASTILVGLPGQLVPVQLKPGSRLPNGAAIVRADPARGLVLLDNGTSLALE